MIKQGVKFIFGCSIATVVIAEEEKSLIAYNNKTVWIETSIIKIKLGGFKND